MVSEVLTVPKGRMCELPVDSITVVDDGNPRQEFGDSDGSLFDLGDSMQTSSQLAPIIINRIDGKNMLIAGERRLRAARHCGMPFIEAKVYEDLEPLVALRMTLAENRERKKLNVIEEARGMQKLFECGLTLKEIADEERCSVDTVTNRLALLKLPAVVQELITRDKNPLPIHQALVLKNLPTDDQIRLSQKAAPASGPVASEETVRAWVQEEVGGSLLPEEKEQDSGDSSQESEESNETVDKGEQNKQHSDADSGGEVVKLPDADPAAEAEKKREVAKKRELDKPVLKPVKANIGIVGKIEICTSTLAYVKGATITVKIGENLKIFNMANFQLDFLEGTDELKEVTKLVKKAQPAPKEDAKKDTGGKKAKSKK